jgi:Flp pilus assembly pilin Flp
MATRATPKTPDLPARVRIHRTGSMTTLFRFVRECDGQDLIEYALLLTFIGFAGAAGWAAMQTGLGNAYTTWVSSVWNLWEPKNPGGGA